MFTYVNSPIIYQIDQKVGPGFGDFWGVFVSLGNAIVLIFLTYVFQEYQSRQQAENDKRDQILDRPVIALKWVGKHYDIVNVGKGAALNIRAFTANKDDLANDRFTSKYYCYSLQKEGVFSAPWLSGMMILIEYTDIFNSLYYTMMEGNNLYVFDERYEALLRSTQTDLGIVTNNFKKYIKFDRTGILMP